MKCYTWTSWHQGLPVLSKRPRLNSMIWITGDITYKMSFMGTVTPAHCSRLWDCLLLEVGSPSHSVLGTLRSSLCFLMTSPTNLHCSPVLRILFCYFESLLFLQSPHHLFALDSTAVCRYWPNTNKAFTIPGGQFNGLGHRGGHKHPTPKA